MTERWRLMSRHFIFLSALFLAWPGRAQAQPMTFVMENFPPFIVDDHGQGVGPYTDVVRAVCAAMQVQCTFKLLPWRRAYAMAQSGAVDGIFVIARNPEREQAFFFSDPVFQSSFAVFARRPNFNYIQPQDLKGFTVATYGPSAVSKEMEALSKTVPNMHLEMEIDNPAVLRKLLAGRYPEPAAAVMNKEVGLHIIAREKLAGVRVAGEFKQIAYAIGLSRNKVNEEQAERFNRTLRELVKQGTIKTIADKYGLKPAS